MNYNLLDEGWIPVLHRDGRWKRVGIRKALEDAGCIRQIAASNPMDRVAILRFLLAVLYWCRGKPPDDVDAASTESFPTSWFSRLHENRECFNLLGDGLRFYQDRGATRDRPVTDLLQEVPTGNNFWHFRHSTDRLEGLCPACCAIGLLRLPLFSVSGLPDLKAGINGTPPVYVVPWGKTLLDTLGANWTACQGLGEPAWVQPGVPATPGEAVPLLTGLTLLARRVWLHDPSGMGDVCISCGGREAPLIRTCEFQTAGKQQTDRWNDPHVVYSAGLPPRGLKAQDLTAAGKFSMDRPWPDLLARLVETGKFAIGRRSSAYLVVGFATGQAKSIDVWERTIALPLDAAAQASSADSMRQWRKDGSTMAKRLRPLKEKMGNRRHVEVSSAVAAIRPHVESSVSARLSELLGGDAPAWDRAAAEYRPMMKVIAKSLSPGFTTGAVRRRQKIASVIPDMRPKTGSPKKSNRRKGGAK